MSGVLRIGAAMASTLVLLAPAIWNRFPLLQFDTGGYLVRWFEGYLVPSRSTVFGLYLNIFATPDFWPVVVLQAALTIWLLFSQSVASFVLLRTVVSAGVTITAIAVSTIWFYRSMSRNGIAIRMRSRRASLA